MDRRRDGSQDAKPRAHQPGGRPMIVREWRGRATFDEADAYPRHFRERVAPELRKILGFIGAGLLRRLAPDGFEFLVLTRWRSLEAIAAFAGDDIESAVV